MKKEDKYYKETCPTCDGRGMAMFVISYDEEGKETIRTITLKEIRNRLEHLESPEQQDFYN